MHVCLICDQHLMTVAGTFIPTHKLIIFSVSPSKLLILGIHYQTNSTFTKAANTFVLVFDVTVNAGIETKTGRIK